MSTKNRSKEFKKGIKAFIKHVESLESSDDGFIDEYVMIQEAQMENHRDSLSSMDVGKLEPNLKKNRYKDIVPYDEYRIVLGHSEGDECSDYINASKIKGVNGTVDYIASQGPLSGTVNDFWRMIWEYDVEIVFMACKLVEMKKIKCSQYWADVGSSIEFGNITVLTVSEQEIFAECIQRTFRVTDGNSVHNVTQLHYCGWPDHGIPKNPDDIRNIIGIMRSSKQNVKAPVLVHCSAGCGRTGTIIAIDYVWTLLEHGKFDESFSLFDLICNLRKQRVSLVQTPDQYALVNKVLKSLCEEMLAKIASHTYENVQFSQEQSNDESIQQTSEENIYEDIWTVDGDSQVKASLLSQIECQTITEERHLGRADKLKNSSPPPGKNQDDTLNLYANSDEVKDVLTPAEKNQDDTLNFANSVEVRSVLPPTEKEQYDTLNLYANSDEIQRQMQDGIAPHKIQPTDVSNNQKPVHTTFIKLGPINGSAVTQVKTLESQKTSGNSVTSASGSCGLLRGSSETVTSSYGSELNVTDLLPSPAASSKESVMNSSFEKSMTRKRESFTLPQDYVTHL